MIDIIDIDTSLCCGKVTLSSFGPNSRIFICIMAMFLHVRKSCKILFLMTLLAPFTHIVIVDPGNKRNYVSITMGMVRDAGDQTLMSSDRALAESFWFS